MIRKRDVGAGMGKKSGAGREMESNRVGEGQIRIEGDGLSTPRGGAERAEGHSRDGNGYCRRDQLRTDQAGGRLVQTIARGVSCLCRHHRRCCGRLPLLLLLELPLPPPSTLCRSREPATAAVLGRDSEGPRTQPTGGEGVHSSSAPHQHATTARSDKKATAHLLGLSELPIKCLGTETFQ